jgi:hypothetical protein
MGRGKAASRKKSCYLGRVSVTLTHEIYAQTELACKIAECPTHR